MKFLYKRIAPGVDRPIIPIGMAIGNEMLAYEAMIDSGADLNVFPASLGEALGLDIESGERGELGGVVAGALAPYYIRTVSIVVGGHRYNRVKVAFMPNLAPYGHGLLGQRRFFDLFKVQFQFLKREIDLREV